MKKIFLLFTCLLYSLTNFTALAQQFNVVGNASTISCTCYEINPPADWQGGAIWNLNPINLGNPFDYKFRVFLGYDNPDHPGSCGQGADGICFVLQNTSTGLSTTGGGLGYQNFPNQSVGIELDTYQNPWDPPYSHLAIEYNGQVEHPTGTLAGPVQMSSTEYYTMDSTWHTFEVVWDTSTQTLSAYFDGVFRLKYAFPGGIISNIFQGVGSNIYWGFTGSTGDYCNLQQVCLNLNADFTTQTNCGSDSVTFNNNSTSGLNSLQSYSWNFGDGDTSSLADPGHTYTSAGVYPVRLVITDQSLCTDTVTHTVTVGVPVLTDSLYGADCKGNTGDARVNVTVDTLSYKLAWSPSPSSVIQTGNSYLAQEPAPGVYHVFVTDTISGCGDTIQFTVASLTKPNVSITPPAELTCTDTSVILTASSTTPGVKYNWGANRTTAVDTAILPGPYTVIITDTISGCTDTASVTVATTSTVAVTLSVKPTNDTICQGSPVIYTATPSGYSSYLFYLGNSLVQNGTSNTYTSNSLTTGSIITVIANDTGCKSPPVSSPPLTVLPAAVSPAFTYQKALCYGISSDTITGTPAAGPGYQYLWSNQATTSTVFLGSVAFSVTVTSTGYCSATFVFADSIRQDPQIFNTNILTLHLCANPAHGDLQLDGKGGTNTFTYAVAGIDSTNTTGRFLGLLPGNYSFVITDSLDCTDIGSVSIPNSIAGDSFTITTDSATCYGFGNGQIIITPKNPDDGPFVYSVDGGSFLFSDTFTGIAAGPHNIVVKSFVFGCEYNYSDTIGQPMQYTLSVNPDTIMTIPGRLDTVTTSTSFPNPVYTWSPVTGLSCTNCAAPVITADTNNMVYSVRVYSTPDSSCYSVDSVVVIVAPPVLPDSFIMPSAFTPNGDGRNDVFGPIISVNFTNPTFKVFKIYNRWGQLVFNGNGPWDGKFDGKDQPVGTYIYYIEVQYPAQDNSTPTYKKEGSVTLLR